MKNISGVLNIVLLVAVSGLYYMQFSGSSSDKVEGTKKEGMIVENPAFVYINSDSLLVNYDYIKDQQEVLKEKSEKLNAEYKNRAQGLQIEFNNYQQNSSNMTIGQARAVEEDLLKKQQNGIDILVVILLGPTFPLYCLLWMKPMCLKAFIQCL